MRYMALCQILEMSKSLVDADNMEKPKQDAYNETNPKEDNPVLLICVS